MDATIYDPRPDLKFINDTENYILIQTHISGNILTYEFWGTDDGRKVEVTQPKIFNITYPGPTKEIVSPDLEPGQRKCTESAHRGADAVFYRTITYASGEKKEETWASTYRPWQAVCLVGPRAENDGDDSSVPKDSE
jgi:vancomycin resistance protein YoaR